MNDDQALCGISTIYSIDSTSTLLSSMQEILLKFYGVVAAVSQLCVNSKIIFATPFRNCGAR